jgi:endonuclease G, mitochondrial
LRFFLQLAFLLFASIPLACAGPIDDCREFVTFGVPSATGDLLCRKGFLLAHDPEKKTPLWVAQHLTPDKVTGPAKRSNNFKADHDLEQGKRAELSDYKGSGFDRGHMAPAGDMVWDRQAMSESFFLSNMVPQVGEGMNRGIWKDLEEKVRKWARERGELFVYSGPIYDKVPRTIGRNKVAVPSYLYKVVLDPKQREALAVIMPNQKLKSEDMPKYLVPVREVEKKTGLDFFALLPDAEEEKIETVRAPRLWN